MARPMSLVGEIEALKASLLSDFEAQKAELKQEITELKAKLGVSDPVEITEEEKAEAEAAYEARLSPAEREQMRLREARNTYKAPHTIDLEASYHPQEIGKEDNGKWTPDGRVIYFTRQSDSQFYRFGIEQDGQPIELPPQLNCDWTDWGSIMKALQTWLNPQGLTMRTKRVERNTEDISALFAMEPGNVIGTF